MHWAEYSSVDSEIVVSNPVDFIEATTRFQYNQTAMIIEILCVQTDFQQYMKFNLTLLLTYVFGFLEHI